MLTKKQREAMEDAWFYLSSYCEDSLLAVEAAEKLRRALDLDASRAAIRKASKVADRGERMSSPRQ